jgi:hypothetical protein
MNRNIKYKQVCKLAIFGNDDINNTTNSQYIVYPSKVHGITINSAGTNYTDANTLQGHAARAQSEGRRRDHLSNLIVRHARRSNPRARESHGPPPSRSHCAPPRAGAAISAL